MVDRQLVPWDEGSIQEAFMISNTLGSEGSLQEAFTRSNTLGSEDLNDVSYIPSNEGCAGLQGQAVHFMRQYWASKQQDSRKRKRERETLAPNNESAIKLACSKVVKYWKQATVCMNKESQRATFQLLLEDPTFQSLGIGQVQQTIFSNIQHSLQMVKQGLSEEELKVKRAACMMMVNSEGDPSRSVSHTQVARLTGLHRRNFAAATSRLNEAKEGSATFYCPRKQAQISILTKEIKDIVFHFWEVETRVSPNKKDICRKRIKRKAYTIHPVHLLDQPQVEFYNRFRLQNPNIKISLRSFEGLKPWFVRKLKDRYTCCCIVHVQMIYLKQALNHIRQNMNGMHGINVCACICALCNSEENLGQCGAHMHLLTSINTLCESLLCAKPSDSIFHNLSCLMGDCQRCQPSRLVLCPRERIETSFQLTVKVFEDIRTEGTTKKRKDLIIKQMNCKDFINMFERHMSLYIKHSFIASWQAQQFRDCVQRFPNDVVVSVIDFAENYSFKEQNEIQSMHWYSSQVTILVHITYVHDEAEDVLKFTHFYISDDKEHDTLFVQHCLQLHSVWIQEQGFNTLKRHWVWSDGCSAQFKAARPFFFVSRYYSLTGLEMMWNFFASGHGKGEHDGAGAVIKRALTHEQLKPNGWQLKCAKDVVDFLNHKFNEEPNRDQPNRIFWEIQLGTVPRDKPWDCKRVKGSRSLHCVNGHSKIDKTALRSRRLSCFCEPCMHLRWRRCLNITHVDEWEYQILQTVDSGSDSSSDTLSDDANTSSDEGFDAPVYGGQHDAISDALCVGDTFATPADDNQFDFYLLQCSRAKYKTTRPLRDAWGNCISPRSYLVEGYYYELVDGEQDVYYIPLHQEKVFLASHLVRAIKIPMVTLHGQPGRFRLMPDDYENIYNSMPLQV